MRAVKQFYSGDLGEILAWREQWGKWPVIVKPAMSGGTDGVYHLSSPTLCLVDVLKCVLES